MRRDGRIRGAVAVACAALAGSWCCLAPPAIASPPAGAPTAGDTAAVWLPLPVPVEEVDEPDRLEDEATRAGATLRGARRDGTFRADRAVIAGESASRGVSAAWLAREGHAPWVTLAGAAGPRRSASNGGGAAVVAAGATGGAVAAGAGAVTIRDAPPLFAAAMGWSRATRRPRSPRTAPPSFEAPPSGASPVVSGGTIAVAIGARGPALWAVGGRRADDRARLGAVGIAARSGPAAWQAALGALEADAGAGAERPTARGIASVTARAETGVGSAVGGSTIAAEVLLAREAAPAIAAEAAASRGPLGLAARWRRLPGEARPVAAEWTATVRATRAAARVTWRPWTSRAEGDDGALEAEGSWRAPGFGPARLRIGEKRGGEDPTSTRERYAVLDLTVATERGRSLAFLASRRERAAPGARGVGATIGGRLTFAARGRAAGTLVVESTRTGGTPGGPRAAWTTALTASGAGTLVTRGRSSVAVSARGWVRIGAMRLRALLRDASGGAVVAGEAPIQATVWIEWGE